MTTLSKVLFYLKDCYSLCHCLFVKVPINHCFILNSLLVHYIIGLLKFYRSSSFHIKYHWKLKF